MVEDMAQYLSCMDSIYVTLTDMFVFLFVSLYFLEYVLGTRLLNFTLSYQKIIISHVSIGIDHESSK